MTRLEVLQRAPLRGRPRWQRLYYRAAGDQPHQPTPSGSTPLLLTVPEACAALRISRWTIYRLIQQRQLRTVRIGNRRLIPAAALGDLIDQLGQEEL